MPFQQIDLEGYARALAARDRSVTEAAGLTAAHLRKLVAKSAELCEFVFEFDAQSPHAGLRERVDALGDNPKRPNHLSRDRSDFRFACLLGGHGTDQTQNVRKPSGQPCDLPVISAQKCLKAAPDMARL